MDTERLRELVRLLKEEALTEITVCEGEERITVRQAATGSGEALSLDSLHRIATDEGAITLTAPLVGTFYARPSPDDEPFVVPGDIVQPGDVIGIIEAMKVMNEVKAEESGRLRRVLVQEGDAVEYGQPLFVFERL
ncbi:acetyl-CoA carboxylase biotin carboxyl carrier protein [Candidatus Bipolaricaulota bacterium]